MRSSSVLVRLHPRIPLGKIRLERIERLTAASEAHIAVRTNEVLRRTVHAEPRERLAGFVDQHTTAGVASQALDPQQPIATCRMLGETLGVPEVPVATQHQRQAWSDDRFLKPDGLPVQR